MAAGKLVGRTIKWGIDALVDIVEEVSKKPKKTKTKAPRKTKAKDPKKPKVKTSRKIKVVGSTTPKTVSRRGRKRISRGRPSPAVAKVMREEGVGRREAEKIVREREKRAVKKGSLRRIREPEVQRTKAEEWELDRLIKGQSKDIIDRRSLMGRVPTGPDRRSAYGLNPSKGPFVEQGPPRSKVIPPRPEEQTPEELASRISAGILGRRGKNIGQYAPPRGEIAEQMRGGGKADPDMEEILQMVKEGRLTLQKKGGQVRAKKRSKSKPRGVGKAMRGWGVVTKGRT